MFSRNKLEEKLYKKRNEHSMKEHKYERYATYTLIIILLIIAVGLIFRAEILCFYAIIPLAVIATIMRLIAWYHHSQERKIHNRLREIKLRELEL